MYQVTIKGRNLDELKKAVTDINNELNTEVICTSLEKNLVDTLETNPFTGKPLSNVDRVLMKETLRVENETVPFPETNETITQSISDALPEPFRQVTTTEVEKVMAESINDTIQQIKDIPYKPMSNVGLELDAEGIPWDKRIHTIKKTKMKNGVWKIKRGTEEALILQVKIELLKHVKQLANPPEVPPMNTGRVVIEQPIQPLQPAVNPAVDKVIEQTKEEMNTPSIPAPLTNVGGHTFDSFKSQFPMILGNLISNGTVTEEYVNQLKAHFQVDQIWNIDEDQTRQVFENFVQFGYVQKVG